jgi:cardiolipin synthase
VTVPEVSGDSADALLRAFNRAAGSPSIAGNHVDLLIDGSETYAAMFQQIDAARRRIHLENYIIHDDACGRSFADRLIARARAGVTVRVMYDWVGSFSTGRRFWNRMREAGIDVRTFGRFGVTDPLLIFARDHRKVLVVDGEHAVAGGLCIGDEWVGNPAKHRQPWRDTAIAVHGPAAAEVDAAFIRAWTFNGGAAPDDLAELGESGIPTPGNLDVRVVATEPGRERNFRTIDLMLGVSGSRIWVTEAYLSAPQRMYQAFKDAARDGADVRLLLPGSSDVRAVRNLSRVGYRGLLKSGVRIWEWNGPMLHAKTIVADGRWVRVGSSNLNPSSLLANWEIDIFAYGEVLARKMERQFLQDLQTSSEVLLRPRRIASVMGRQVYPALARQAPADEAASRHSRSFRERRVRAIVLLGSVIQGARAAIFGPLALILLVSAVLFALLPRPMACISCALCALFGAALLVRALGHRARG